MPDQVAAHAGRTPRRVSKETGKPILVCVNMDGEIASEHYAGVRYRQPEIATLYEPYVCVIASVYRHTPRDYDEQGRRILCPRFGSVTCGEHIAIEPILFEKFFDGKRIAPRHIGVELDGKEMYDVYYAWDTDTIFNNLKDGHREAAARSAAASCDGDRSLVENVASRDNEDRDRGREGVRERATPRSASRSWTRRSRTDRRAGRSPAPRRLRRRSGDDARSRARCSRSRLRGRGRRRSARRFACRWRRRRRTR